MIDLEKLTTMLDAALAVETPETLNQWLDAQIMEDGNLGAFHIVECAEFQLPNGNCSQERTDTIKWGVTTQVLYRSYYEMPGTFEAQEENQRNVAA